MTTPYTTRTGLQIGRCYVPKRPPRSFTLSEETVQRALLPRPPVSRRERIAGVVLAIGIGIALAVLLAHHLSKA